MELLVILLLLFVIGYLIVSPFLMVSLFARIRELERHLTTRAANDAAIEAHGTTLRRLERRLSKLESAGLSAPATVAPAASAPVDAGAPVRVAELVDEIVPIGTSSGQDAREDREPRSPGRTPAAFPAAMPVPARQSLTPSPPPTDTPATSALPMSAAAPRTAHAGAARILSPASPVPAADARPAAPAGLRSGTAADTAESLPEAIEPAPGFVAERLARHVRRIADRLRAQLPREEWEAVIGTSWLNKIGVFVLVIGISLFIGYSLTQFGPAGRVAIGLAAGVLMLAAGITCERQARFVIFGRGLIGGGWAATYFTTFAMHGLEAARVVASPALATGLLMAVAAAMIAHSLHYRAQTVTAVGYSVGFATLAIAPVSTFAMAATVPLAATLVWVAYRFAWMGMAAVGLVTTYGVFVVTAEPLAGLTSAQFAREQLILGMYWLMFEAFDALSERRSGRAQVARFLFPLNATAFLGVSLLRWTTVTPATLYLLLGAAAGAYLVSAAGRALLAKPHAIGTAGAVPGVDARSYRAPVTVAVALTIAGVFLRFVDMQVTLALLLVGQLVLLSGLRFGDVYLRWLAGAPLAIVLVRLVFVDAWGSVQAPIGGLEVFVWTPVALLAAAVFYLDRAIVSSRGPIELERTYRTAASALIVLAAALETPFEYLGAAWLVLALALFEPGLRDRLREFRVHAYVTGAAAIVAAASMLFEVLTAALWIPLALVAAAAYGWVIRLELPRAVALDSAERSAVWHAASWVGTVSVTALLWVVVPQPYTPVAWLVFAGGLFDIGLRARFRRLRPQAYAVGILAAVVTLATSVLVTHGAHWDALALVTLLTTLAAARPYARGADRLDDDERERLRSAGSWLALFFGGALLWHVLPRPWVSLGWLLLAVMLLEIALRLGRGESRAQAYAVAVLASEMLFVHAFPPVVNAGQLFGLLGGAGVLYSGVFGRLLKSSPRGMPDTEHRVVRDIASACAAACTAVLCWHLLPVALVALAWGGLGFLLLHAGITQRLPGLRMQGHLLLALTVCRLLLANLTATGALAGLSHRLLTVLPVIVLLYSVSVWLRGLIAEGRTGDDPHVPCLYLYAGTALTVVLLQFELGTAMSVAGWAVMAAGLLALGLRTGDTDLRAQAYLIAMLAFVRAWTGSVTAPESFAGTADRIAIAAIVIGSFYLAQLLLARAPATAGAAGALAPATLVVRADRHARPAFSVLATLLLATLLFSEIPAGLLTVAWALQGTTLLGIGFAARDRVLRRSGLVLLVICTVKAFAYDFRHLETLTRVLSFIVLGLLMLATSWVYARYNDRLRRML